MNPNIRRLHNIAQQPSRLIVGLMSGTSVDGLDVALCRCTGAGLETKIEIVHFETITYDKNFKAEVKAVFSRKDADLEKVCLLNSWIALQHAKIILQCLQNWGLDPASIDLIASHGQTIYHAPKFLHRQDQFSEVRSNSSRTQVAQRAHSLGPAPRLAFGGKDRGGTPTAISTK